MSFLRALLLAVLVTSLAGLAVPLAAPEAAAASTPELKGTLKGADIYRYRLEGRKGETVTLALDASSPIVIFRLVRVKTGEAIVSNPVRFWSGKLPANGEYDVEIYLTDTGETRPARFTLWVTAAD